MSRKNKPSIRFTGFTDDWGKCKSGEVAPLRGGFAFKSNEYGSEGIPILRISNILSDGTVGANYAFYDEQENDEAFTLYDGAAVLAMSGATTGKVSVLHAEKGQKYYQNQRVGYFVPTEKCDYSFTRTVVKSQSFMDQLSSVLVAGAQPNVSSKEIDGFEYMIPSSEKEQKAIGSFFEFLDNLISLHQSKYDKLVNVKKSMLEKMFPREGAKVPELRFAGFTDDWQQGKFSELVTIERGGSPRPIDKFITKDKNGLNWIKIGDAPVHGNYITQTAEKIKPEGLSKTREVHPGDLILSNSMSFGRPYIMAIDGCIHDGWLAIRDEEKRFDLKFLCTLLGTDGMLNQYKSMAAGSSVSNLNKELVSETTVLYPNMDEQEKLGEFFYSIDNLISLYQCKVEKLKNIKSSMMEKMFV